MNEEVFLARIFELLQMYVLKRHEQINNKIKKEEETRTMIIGTATTTTTTTITA